MDNVLLTAIEALIEAEVQRRLAAAQATAARPLTVKAAADRLGLSTGTIYGMVREGKIATLDTGTSRVLIPASEVDRLLDGSD